MDDDRELRDLLDLVGVVPHQLGRRPGEGCVAVALPGAGRRRRIGPMIRMPVEGMRRAAWPEALAAAVAAQAAGGGGVALLRYDRAPESQDPGADAEIPRLEAALADRGLLLLIVIDVGPATAREVHPGWGEPRSIAELESSPAATRLIVEGSAPGPEGRVDADRFRRFARARAGWVRLGSVEVEGRRRALLRRWIDLAEEESLAGAPPARRAPSDLCAASGVAAGQLAFRDAVLAILVSPEVRAEWSQALRRAAAGPDPDPSRLPGLGPHAPDIGAARRAEGLLQDWAAMERGPEAAVPLSMLAWIDWMLLRGEDARLRVDAALARDPGCSLARLLDRALHTGLPPRWAARVGEERNTRGTMER